MRWPFKKLNIIATLLRGPISHYAVPALSFTPVACYDDYQALAGNEEYQKQVRWKTEVERNLVKMRPVFTVPGFCVVCARKRRFIVDYKYACIVDGVKVPNWRERLICPFCWLNNRQRAVVHLLHTLLPHQSLRNVYITEQTTFLFDILSNIYPGAVGSEFLGESIPLGTRNKAGIRNETLCQLTFADDRFDAILSLDVLEHIPEYHKALTECYRCLKPGGSFLFSVPFLVSAKTNLVRAKLSENDEVELLLKPEYHGDPIANEGCLCFYHFGWELLEKLRACGYSEVRALLYWSLEYGYLGGEQIIFEARK